MAKAKKAAGTRKVNGKTLTKSSCHTTSKAAKDKAASLRKAGKKARTFGLCVFTN
jgi:hypothetical protein